MTRMKVDVTATINDLIADELAATTVMLIEAIAQVRRLRDGIDHAARTLEMGRYHWHPVEQDLRALLDPT